MNVDILVAGVGGQGVISVSAVIAAAAQDEGLQAKMSEVHGMSQRGGAVVTDLRIADHPIHSNLIPSGQAAMILGMEPVEGLRYLGWLSPAGMLITSADPVINVPDYPPIERVLSVIRSVPGSVIIEAGRLAREAGSPKGANFVMVGAASIHLPLDAAGMEKQVYQAFLRKGERVAEENLEAFRAGRLAVTQTCLTR